jgi:dephospho-CoA kinase
LRDFEYWSQLCLRAYFAEYVQAEPSYLIRRKKNFARSSILCVLGPVGSGKTEATGVFTKDYGYTEINSGVLLGDILGLPPVPNTPRADFQRAALKFIRSADGPAKLAKAISRRAQRVERSRILVDGIRNRLTLIELEKIVGSNRLALIYVHTPADIAFRFYQDRLGRSASIQEFIAVRESPVESEVTGMIEDADAVLYNWTGKMGYRQTIQSMMQELGLNQ